MPAAMDYIRIAYLTLLTVASGAWLLIIITRFEIHIYSYREFGRLWTFEQ
jgi:hypothetical protein